MQKLSSISNIVQTLFQNKMYLITLTYESLTKSLYIIY